MRHPFHDPAVANAFAAFPQPARTALLQLRDLIFEVAADTPEAGRIEETLKWGQPAYLTPDTKSGSTLRLSMPKNGGIGVYTHCQTTIMSDFQMLFPEDFTYEGNRAVHFKDTASLDTAKLRLLIKSALTYHLKPR